MSDSFDWAAAAPALSAKDLKPTDPLIVRLDAHLNVRTYLSGYDLSPLDILYWTTIRQNHKATAIVKQGILINVTRWFSYIEQAHPEVAQKAVAAKAPPKVKTKEEEIADNYGISLPDADKGVVTRFPPEPSGYLHIGHAKAALLNDYFAHVKYKGTLLLRFDDTNPSKEKQEFEDAIIEDLALMGIKPDKTSHTSDWFQELYEYAVQMLKEGTAYADDTEQEVLRKERMEGIASKRRDASIEENLAHFEEMKQGTEAGRKWFIRAKMSVDDPNKALRDPVIYRCNPESHHRTGDKWKIYPTYDFCCPIVDALEGVTHALRTSEYKDRDAQYQWFLKTLRLRHVYNWDFSRLNFVRTLLSKRKLTKFVETGHVWGWDDPRMPTVRGVRRRGMTVPALRDFILSQGPSKNIVNLDWTSFWAINKKVIDLLAGRFTAIEAESVCPVTLTGQDVPESPVVEEKPRHAKYKDLGSKKVVFSKNVRIEQADAKSLDLDEEITLMNWGNAFVRKVLPSPHADVVTGVELELNLGGDVKKTKKKITWLSTDQELTPVELYDFDYLITKDKLADDDNYEDFLTPQTEFKTVAIADMNVRDLKKDDIIQFDRKGYYRVDSPADGDSPARLFLIPTGKK